MKVTAAATRAVTAAQILLSTTITPAPLVALALAPPGVAAATTPVEVVVADVVPAGVTAGATAGGNGFAAGVVVMRGVDVVLVGIVVFPAGTPAGGGVAEAGLTRAPVPHGMASPSGCVGLVGAVEAPDASASANRVVHKVSLEAGLVNW